MRQAVLNLEESKIREVANAGMGRADASSLIAAVRMGRQLSP